MDESLDLSADVSGDATAYIQDAVDGVGAAQTAVSDANTQIQSALGFANRAVGAVSGALGNYGFNFGPVHAPSAHPAITASPMPVQVGSTMTGNSASILLYVLLAIVGVVVLVYALG